MAGELARILGRLFRCGRRARRFLVDRRPKGSGCSTPFVRCADGA